MPSTSGELHGQIDTLKYTECAYCLRQSRYTRSPNFSVETTDQDLINPLYTGFRWIRPVLQRVREEAVGKSEISHPRVGVFFLPVGVIH